MRNSSSHNYVKHTRHSIHNVHSAALQTAYSERTPMATRSKQFKKKKKKSNQTTWKATTHQQIQSTKSNAKPGCVKSHTQVIQSVIMPQKSQPTLSHKEKRTASSQLQD